MDVSNIIVDHKSKGKYTNNHLLHINTGVATEKQVEDSIKKTMALAKDMNLPYKSQYRISLVTDRYGKTFGYAYVWFTNPEVFNMLIGKNPNGSDRSERIDDPNWRPPIEPIQSTSWADIEEYECIPKITVVLPPLIKLVDYELDEGQRKIVNGSSQTNITHGRLECSQTFVSDPEQRYQGNVLCSTNVPEAITVEDLKNFFTPFVSDPTKTRERKVNNGTTTIIERYPIVTITSNRIAFITFDQSTNDATFVHKVTRKVEFKRNGKSYLLMFSFALNK
jgi:hypothetical protein